MRHVLSALVMNRPGVLAHISGMLASREFNIESLAVGATENPEFSRMTFVVAGDARVLDQIRKQLEKIVTVVKVIDYSNQEFVERDLMLIKVSTQSGTRSQVKELVDIFRGRIVGVSCRSSHDRDFWKRTEDRIVYRSGSPFRHSGDGPGRANCPAVAK